MKIPRDAECPLDLAYVDMGRMMHPLMRGVGVTPNGITGVSGVLGVMSVLRLWKGDVGQAAVFHWASYVLDCWDGDFARATGQESAFGDAFDHWKDVLVLGAYMALLCKMMVEKRGVVEMLVWVALMALMACGASENTSCANRYYGKDEVGAVLDQMCLVGCELSDKQEILKFLRGRRWISVGMMNLIVVAMTLRLGDA